MRIRTNNSRWANFKVLECELYGYQQNKKDLEALREDIILETALPDVAAQTGPGKVVEAKALRLCSSRVLLELERRIRAIEYALGVLEGLEDKRRLQLVEMKYFERRYTDLGIQIKLDISDSTFRRWRRDFVQLVADRLGFEI